MSQSLNLVKSKFDELPNNIEAEQSVIGSILLTNEIFDEISILISSKNFYDPMHQKIFSAIESLIYKGMLANPITLKNHFENQKDELDIPEYLVKITKFSTSVRQSIEYSKLIYDLYVKRELIKISDNIIDTAKLNDLNNDGQNIIENFEKSLFDLAEKGSFSSSIVKFDEAMRQTIEMASNAYKNEEGIVGVPSGLRDLDDRLGGMHKSDLIIIAGRPSMGKTALGTNIAFNVAKSFKEKIDDIGNKKLIDGGKVAFFSLEMSSEQLATRILAEQTRISGDKMRKAELSKDDFKKIAKATSDLEDLNLFIDDNPILTIATLRARARRLQRLHGIDLIIIDYLQLMSSTNRSKNENRVQEISEITRGLKAIAKELNIPIIALSQLSRQVEQREDKRPQLSDLRESGTIEQDSDVVMFIFRESYYLERMEPIKKPEEIEEKYQERTSRWQELCEKAHNTAEIIIAKQRHGPIGTIKTHFDSNYTRFSDMNIKDYDNIME